MAKFPSRVRHVQDGEPVNASVTSRPTQALQAQTQYLYELLMAAEAGKALVHRGVTVEAAAQVGQPVFWNATTCRYELAMAGVESDPVAGVLRATPASDTLGLVLAKGPGPTDADVVLMGVVTFDSLAAAIDGPVSPGRYYLSAAEPGKLVQQRPPASVAVCYVYGTMTTCETQVTVFVLPQMRDFLEDHIHYQFALAAQPAGDHVVAEPDGTHTIANPDSTLRGWLPADHSSFGGRAPTGAKFGYNLAAHPEVARVWPPIPIQSCLLEMLRPENADPLTGFGRVASEYVQFTTHGIWWMSDCYGEVPWPTHYTGENSSSSLATTCPTVSTVKLLLSFVRMTFTTDKTVVTSLRPATGSPFEIVDCDGQPATTGDLYARLRLDAATDTAEYHGGQVLKVLLDGFRFGRGWVTEGFIAGSDYVVLNGTQQRRLTPGDTSTPVVHQGIVTVDVNINPERELVPDIVQLNDALEREYRNVMYLGLPSGRTSSLRLRFNIPSLGLPTNPQFTLRTQLLALSDGNFPSIQASYYRLPRPSPTAVALTEGDTALPAYGASMAVEAAMTYETLSGPIPISPGDTLYVSITRSATAVPVYGDDVGFLRFTGLITAGVAE